MGLCGEPVRCVTEAPHQSLVTHMENKHIVTYIEWSAFFIALQLSFETNQVVFYKMQMVKRGKMYINY